MDDQKNLLVLALQELQNANQARNYALVQLHSANLRVEVAEKAYNEEYEKVYPTYVENEIK